MRYALLAVLSAFLLLGCELPSQDRPGRDQMFPSEEFPSTGTEAIYAVALSELDRTGFSVDRVASSEAAGKFETHWRNFLAPFRFEGRRKKVIGEVEESESRPGYFRVYLTVWNQRNADIEDPLNAASAIWQDTEPDQGLSDAIIYKIQNHFSDDFLPR